MKNNLILSHIDLDGVCSAYLAHIVFDTNIVISSNYNNVQKQLDFLFFSYGKDYNLIITDLNISPTELQYALKHFKTVTIFDHHDSSANFIPLEKINKKFKIYFSADICATTLVQIYMIENGHKFSETEKKFFRYVNIYDVWKYDHKEFTYARIANDLFWYYGWSNFLKKLNKNGVFDIPTGLTSKELQHCKSVFDKISDIGKTCEWYNTESGSTVVILEEKQKVAINHISSMLQSYTGVYYIVYFGGVYRCSIRVNSINDGNYDIGKELIKFKEKHDVFEFGGGHQSAAGTSFKRNIDIDDVLIGIETFDSFLFNK